MHRKKVKKTVKLTVPKGTRVYIKRKATKRNPVIFQFGGKKRKFFFSIGRKKKEDE